MSTKTNGDFMRRHWEAGVEMIAQNDNKARLWDVDRVKALCLCLLSASLMLLAFSWLVSDMVRG
jgi:hypothetical protein